MFEVRLKPGHPTGTYRRGGVVFTREPQKLEKVSKEIEKDPWLEVVGVKPAGPPPGKANQR